VFRFDEAAQAQGAHHQKFAVIDGQHAFVGGIDLCEARWDDRAHRTHNPLRTSRGEPSKPYHDVQAHLEGREVAGALRDLFVERWARSGGGPLELVEPQEPALPELPGVPCIRLGAGPVALSRTDPHSDGDTVNEVEHLLVDAIGAAERLVYIETQYFSSSHVRDALIARMQDPRRSRLQIALVVNERADGLKEELAVGLRQAKNLERLREVAAETGHALGIYVSLSDGAGEAQRPTFIHSKLLLVDDRFLTIGSANLTNRSMELDSELNASWEAPVTASALGRAIRRLRVSLLAEHAGLVGTAAIRPLVTGRELVARLDALTTRPGARLRPRGPLTPAQRAAMRLVDPEDLPFDPVRREAER
jgi:phospholipase D1/2